MNFSEETKEKIKQFAKEQSKYYLEEVEMTYLEQLRQKTGQMKSKFLEKFAKLKSRSDISIEAENDMILYMSDYMKDLMESGLSEQEALERAKKELQFRSDTVQSDDLQKRFAKYYENCHSTDLEIIGLFYGGFLFFGLSIGALIGFILGGGKEMFLSGGWLETMIGAAVGTMIGIGMGQISNALVLLKSQNK